MRTLCVALIVAWSALTSGPAAAVAAQQAPASTGTGVIAGQVVDGVTRLPVDKALVRLGGARIGLPLQGFTVTVIGRIEESRGPAGRYLEAMTDAQGRFTFTSLPAGTYGITARRAGWVDGVHGAGQPEDQGRPLQLAARQRADVRIDLWPFSTISGRVVDESGEPLAGASVDAMQWTLSAGRRKLALKGHTITHDRGGFNLRIPPGGYVLTASSDQQRAQSAGAGTGRRRSFVFRRIFYPSSLTAADAESLSLRPGDERTGVEIRLPFAPAVRLSGVLRNTTGSSVMPRSIVLITQNGIEARRGAAVDQRGRFAFDGLSSGQYLLEAVIAGNPEPSTPPALWARALVDVGDENGEIVLDLQRELLVRGRIQFDGVEAPPGDLSRWFHVSLTSPDSEGGEHGPPSVPVGPDGRFAVELPPGRYVVSGGGGRRFDLAGPPSAEVSRALERPWRLRSATLAGRDLADTPLVLTGDVSGLVLTFTDRQAALRGRLTERQDEQAATVVMFPPDEAMWVDFGVGRRIRTTTVLSGGTFSIVGPAGDYLVAAVRGVREMKDSALLGVLARRAQPVALYEGESARVDVPVLDMPVVNPGPERPPEPLLADRLQTKPLVAAASAAAAGSTITGRVVDEDTGRPLAAVRVGRGSYPSPNDVSTDEQGQFVLTGVPAGQHTIRASKPPYVTAAYGARRPGLAGISIAVANGQRLAGLDIAMTRGAVIAGTVLDENSKPVGGAEVQLWLQRWSARGPELSGVGPAGLIPADGLGPRTTDHLGGYRFYGLPPGDYIVSARLNVPGGGFTFSLGSRADAGQPADGAPRSSDAGPSVRYVPLFYPGVTESADAEIVKLVAGAERELNFQLALAGNTVSGVVRSPDGPPSTNFTVRLVPLDRSLTALGVQPSIISTERSGAFTIRGVLPGRYVLGAQIVPGLAAPRPSGLAAYMDLVVDGRDQTDLVLDLLPGATIAGRVRMEPASPADPKSPLRIMASAVATPIEFGIAGPVTTVDPDGRFTLSGVLPGRYRLALAGATTAQTISQVLDGRETIDAGIEVRPGERVQNVELVLTDALPSLSGTVRDSTNRPTGEPFVVLFANEPEAWTPPSRRIFGARPDLSGRYSFRNVPPGEYRLALLADAQPNDWLNPALLTTLLGGATPVTIRAGQMTHDLTFATQR